MIIEDMDWAIERLPRLEDYDADNIGRAHDAAAVAFKAKVYAYWATWEPEKWKDVIAMVNDLESTYAATWQALWMKCSLRSLPISIMKNTFGPFPVMEVPMEAVPNFPALS